MRCRRSYQRKQESGSRRARQLPNPTEGPANSSLTSQELPQRPLTAVAAGSFNTLVTAVQAAGLVETLKGDGPFTVFAPTDEAFAAIPAADLEALLADKEKLTAVLTYHVVPGKVMAADVVGLDSATTVQGSDVDIEVVDGGVTIDGANVGYRQQNIDGGTALMGAAASGHTTTVQVLLDAKADASLQNRSGNKTALILAEGRKHIATAQLLRQHAQRQAVEEGARTAASVAHGVQPQRAAPVVVYLDPALWPGQFTSDGMRPSTDANTENNKRRLQSTMGSVTISIS